MQPHLFTWFLSLASILAQGSSPSKIAFVSERDGNVEIYSINPDGSGLTNLTNDPAEDANPAWSPDGSKIAFRRGLNHMMVMHADGSNAILLATSEGDNAEFDLTPGWSPDGTRIVFDTETGEGRDIFVVKADGSGQTNLTHDRVQDSRPRWSPDGSTILFESNRAAGGGLYRMSPEGTDIVWLAEGTMGAWSPDGSQIVFVAEGGEIPESDIVAIKSDGSDRRLLISGALASLPVWSPDGSKIAFRALEGEGFALFVMRADGSNNVRVATNLLLDFEGTQPPAWSPDGAKLAFTTADYDIFVVDADGANSVALAPHPAGDADPVWSPVVD